MNIGAETRGNNEFLCVCVFVVNCFQQGGKGNYRKSSIKHIS